MFPEGSRGSRPVAVPLALGWIASETRTSRRHSGRTGHSTGRGTMPRFLDRHRGTPWNGETSPICSARCWPGAVKPRHPEEPLWSSDERLRRFPRPPSTRVESEARNLLSITFSLMHRRIALWEISSKQALTSPSMTQVKPVNADERQRATAWCALRLGRNP